MRLNFIAIAGDLKSAELVEKVKTVMKKNAKIGIESISGPRSLPGIGLSDHRSYWEHGFPAVMLTDTAFFRNPHYHQSSDTPETLNYEKMSAVVDAVRELALNF